MPEVRPIANLRSILALEETEKLLQLDMDQLEFFRATTGIQDDSVLRAHIVAIQREAYTVRPPPLCLMYLTGEDVRPLTRIEQVQPYPSIVNFNFVKCVPPSLATRLVCMLILIRCQTGAIAHAWVPGIDRARTGSREPHPPRCRMLL